MVSFDELYKQRQGKIHLGKMVRLLRESDDLSSKELAKRLDKSPQFVSAVECGKKAISLEVVVQFANALGYPPEQFIEQWVSDRVSEIDENLTVTIKRAS